MNVFVYFETFFVVSNSPIATCDEQLPLRIFVLYLTGSLEEVTSSFIKILLNIVEA